MSGGQSNIRCALAAVFVVVGLVVPVQAGTLYVSLSGDNANDGQSWATAKRTVQAGFDAAVSGEQVWVAAGTYVENITLEDGVALYGGFAGNEDPATFDLADRDFAVNETTLDANSSGHVVTAPQAATETTRIDGFTIRNGSGSSGGILCVYSSPTIANNTIMGNGDGGIYCYGSSPTIANNTIMGNTAYVGGGIYCGNSSSPTIANNMITGNGAVSGGGIYCDYSSPTIANNTITGNGAVSGGGIFCIGSSLIIANNTIVGNGGCAICCVASSPTIANTIIAFNSSGVFTGLGTPVLRHNCVFGNGDYDYSGITNPTGTDGNISADPRLAGETYGNVHIQPDSPCVDAGDNAHAFGDYDMDGQPRIQPAGGTVDIGADESDGTLWPEGPYVIVRVSPDGDDANDGASWAQAKRTVQAGIDAASAGGGEVWVRAGTYYERITLPPYAYLYGGFAGTENARDEREWATNETILDGQASGNVVTVRAGCQVSTIDGFTIRNGSASYGGGIYCDRSSPTIANNTITGNSAHDGGGIYCVEFSPTIANNTIMGNSAFWGGGGIYCNYSSPTITNNTITGNNASHGGGIWCISCSPTIANNTIAGNSANYYGGGIYCEESSPTIANTIIAFNSSGIYAGEGDTPVLRHNCVFGNADYDYSGITNPTGTDGNISADPRLAGVAYGNAPHIQPDSPCVEAGDNAYAVGDYDMDGQPRIQPVGGTVDIGADEYPAISPDLDFDGDVDLTDFAAFAACFNGSNRSPALGCAADADFDFDADVDMIDFSVFQACFNGPNRPPAAGCP